MGEAIFWGVLFVIGMFNLIRGGNIILRELSDPVGMSRKWWTICIIFFILTIAYTGGCMTMLLRA